MSKSSIYYIITNFFLFSILQLGDLMTYFLVPICIAGLFTVGIAHGSIDHILSGANDRTSKMQFVRKYLLMIFIIGGLWLYVPNLSLFIFLVLSAYHFGQSQFVDYSFPDALSTRFLYLSWGLVLFTLLFFLKSEQLQSDFSNYLPNITSWGFIADNSFVIFCCTLVMWLTLFIYKIIVHNKSVQGIFSEIYLLFLISISFYIFPTLIGFSLYFIILHSFRSLDQEFNHLFSDYTKQNIWNFIKLLLPFSALAIIGSALIIFILYRLGYQTHLPYLLLIILSSITTPHTFVMDYFLEKGRHSSILSDSVQI